VEYACLCNNSNWKASGQQLALSSPAVDVASNSRNVFVLNGTTVFVFNGTSMMRSFGTFNYAGGIAASESLVCVTDQSTCSCFAANNGTLLFVIKNFHNAAGVAIDDWGQGFEKKECFLLTGFGSLDCRRDWS
jgi:outer membrane protein assembly factor BamB